MTVIHLVLGSGRLNIYLDCFNSMSVNSNRSSKEKAAFVRLSFLLVLSRERKSDPYIRSLYDPYNAFPHSLPPPHYEFAAEAPKIIQ